MSADRLRIGAVVDGGGIPTSAMLDIVDHVEGIGMDSVWLPQMPNQLDVATVLAALAAHTKRVRLASAVLPMYSRPPVVMAQSALTADAISGGRVALGLGLGHRAVGDWMVGGQQAPALPATREYLTVVTSLVRDGEVNVDGTWYSGHAAYIGERRDDLPVYLGSFGPKMLELAGELADGAILWMCTTDYLTTQVFPALRRGWARRGGRPDNFKVVAMMHAGLSGDPDRDRQLFGRTLGAYLRVATYRGLFSRSGFADSVTSARPDDAMVRALGAFTEDEVAQRLEEFRRCGVDDIGVAPAGAAKGSFDLCLRTLTNVFEIAGVG
jgi:alkanesulfonate monooxygenase SsuD/methylene tetrahydromethanopterin reductase-like flavin-dependent oxidoreductase (luciferase family)